MGHKELCIYTLMENGIDCCSGHIIYLYTVQCLLKIHSHNIWYEMGQAGMGEKNGRRLLLVKIMPHPFPPLRKWNLCSSHASQCVTEKIK